MLKLLLVIVFVGSTQSNCPGEDQSQAPLPITRVQSTRTCEYPYHPNNNCTCPPSMYECACHASGKCKWGKPECINTAWTNDGDNDCGDWSDELSDVCTGDRVKCDCFNTTCPGRLGCLNKSQFCLGRIRCPDGSDSPGCACPSGRFECECYRTKSCPPGSDGCIFNHYQCDGKDDCGDKTDEVNCTCPDDMFECQCYKSQNCPSQFNGCIAKELQCNSENNCGDWSDEVNCTCPDKAFQCNCHANQNCRSGYSGCVAKSYLCNGYNDCGDWSDEYNCTCPADKFSCQCYKTQNCSSGYGGCINEFYRCDGDNDCGDWSDEVNCTCSPRNFECQCFESQSCPPGYDGCIGKFYQCDGQNQCGDWSDEANCTCPVDTFQCSCYGTLDCTPGYAGCVNELYQCDGDRDCSDWSDELGCACDADRFECECRKTNNCSKPAGGCVDSQFRCDGEDDCGDASDEANCTCPVNTFSCACVASKKCVGENLRCVDRSLLCDGKRDCVDGSDEDHYSCNCSGIYTRCMCDPNNNKPCSNEGRCIPFSWIGDSFADCRDGSDEACSIVSVICQDCDVVAVTCPTETKARNILHSEAPLQCNAVFERTCATDEKGCKVDKVVCTTTNCSSPPEFCGDVFFCDDNQLVSKDGFCNGQSYRPMGRDCKDRSDEVVKGFGFRCSGHSRKRVCVLPQTNVYDSVAQCSDSSDICFHNGEFKCFQCLDRKLIISTRQVCDGMVDCFDLSDECLCANQTLCREVRGQCPPNKIRCNESCVAQDAVLCNASVVCHHRTNTKFCSIETEPKPAFCADDLFNDNIYDSTCDKTLLHGLKQQGQALLTEGAVSAMMCDGTSNDDLGVEGELFCPNRFRCFSKGEVNVARHKVCDGAIDCDDGSDEFYDLCNDVSYYCPSKGRFSISRKNVCDGIIDCDNRSDESRCRCENFRFFCTNGERLSIEWRLVQNGINDCSDGSDECLNLIGNAFADINEMIANPVFRAIFWVTGVLALGGNLFVFATTARDLAKVKRDQNLFINASVFVVNLCVSDFLMGVYLLAIVAQATAFAGSYCYFDKLWRSSGLCSGLGALAVVSSEASALIMTSMTTFRLISAYNPFLMRNIGVTASLVSVIFSWVAAILLAIVPLLPSTSEYFVTDVWFPNNFYETDFVSRENMSLLAERISNSNISSWNDVKRTIKDAFPRNQVNTEFGYYGETSVCMPRLFATSGEFAWEYSVFLIVLNVILFIYMVVAYILVYRRSNAMKGSRSTDISTKMQKRITRLILTDFCCWIPICAMGFLSAGGVKMPGDAYVLSACLLLPINSALNPLLYSKVLEERLLKIKKWLTDESAFARTTSSRSTHLSSRYSGAATGAQV